MGALHLGHVSLITRARRDCARVVVSVFVNPLQFENSDDYRTYPRQLSADLALLARERVDAVFCPQDETLYPEGFATRVEVGHSQLWEAARRPGHFSGVVTLVGKLFAAAGPCRAYFGDKDAQQAALVRRLALDLDFGIEVVVCPTVRDSDGVALSSRNRLLSPAGRMAARCLPLALARAGAAFSRGARGGPELVRQLAVTVQSEPQAQLDYAGVVDPLSFKPQEDVAASSRLMLAVAIEGVHLVDTCLVASPPRAEAR